VLNLVKETLDEIALAIERKIAFVLVLAIGLWWDHGSHSVVPELVDERIGVKRLIGNDRARVGIFRAMVQRK
jgi:hypothetical protein